MPAICKNASYVSAIICRVNTKHLSRTNKAESPQHRHTTPYCSYRSAVLYTSRGNIVSLNSLPHSLLHVSWQSIPTINSISQLGGIRSVLRIPLITVNVQLIQTSGVLDMLVILDGVQPASPSAVRLWIGPAAIVSQYSGETDHPGCELNIYIGELGAKEKGAVLVSHVDDFADFVFEFGGVLCLFIEFLRLEKVVEGWYDVTVDLWLLDCNMLQGSIKVTYVVGPKSAISSELRIIWREKRWAGAEILKLCMISSIIHSYKIWLLNVHIPSGLCFPHSPNLHAESQEQDRED